MKPEFVVQLVLAGLLIVGYIVLTALGKDGNPLLLLLGGQALGGGADYATKRSKKA